MTFFDAARSCEQEGQPFVVVTLVSSRGHAPQDPGAKVIVTRDGLKWGTVGGGKIEARCIAHAMELLNREEKAPEIFTWNLQKDIGMSCGGEVVMLFEAHQHDLWKIVVFGAGHVAQSLTRGLLLLDCQVTCIDPREEWLSRLPEGIQRICMPRPEQWLEHATGKEFFVCMTQGHAVDLPILTALLKRFPDAPYMGVIGSKVKGIKLRSELKAAGIDAEIVAKLRCPMGFPIGNNHPGEIAISVIAQLLEVRDAASDFHGEPGE